MANESAQSVPAHLSDKNPQLWRVNFSATAVKDLLATTPITIGGSAFIDLSAPLGKLGNPFAVIVDGQNRLNPEAKRAIAVKTGTPETIFLNSYKEGLVNLTVLTPTGNELGACAHGFLGGLTVLKELGFIASNCEVHTTADTSCRVELTPAGFLLAFNKVAPSTIEIEPSGPSKLISILSKALNSTKNEGAKIELPVYSVGSGKLAVELSDADFEELLAAEIPSYEELQDFQELHNINGIYYYCRTSVNSIKCCQVNYKLGADNYIDPATGVALGGLIVSDERFPVGENIEAWQYTKAGLSAKLIAKTDFKREIAYVGGAATLFGSAPVSELI